MDEDSSSWLAALRGQGAECRAAQAQLHELLLKAGLKEAYRRGPGARISGPELEDLAHQAANDAMVSLLHKLDSFRGESRFITWAYRFVVLEISSKLGRHFWRRPCIPLDTEEWDRLPERHGALDPLAKAEHQDLIAAVKRAVDTLTERQRLLFVATVVNGIPIDAMSARCGATPGAIYKAVFDARRKIRAYLTTNGYLEGEAGMEGVASRRVKAELT